MIEDRYSLNDLSLPLRREQFLVDRVLLDLKHFFDFLHVELESVLLVGVEKLEKQLTAALLLQINEVFRLLDLPLLLLEGFKASKLLEE